MSLGFSYCLHLDEIFVIKGTTTGNECDRKCRTCLHTKTDVFQVAYYLPYPSEAPVSVLRVCEINERLLFEDAHLKSLFSVQFGHKGSCFGVFYHVHVVNTG